MQVLEHMGTRQAKEVLQSARRRVPEARRTEEAKASLRRLGSTTAKKKMIPSFPRGYIGGTRPPLRNGMMAAAPFDRSLRSLVKVLVFTVVFLTAEGGSLNAQGPSRSDRYGDPLPDGAPRSPRHGALAARILHSTTGVFT